MPQQAKLRGAAMIKVVSIIMIVLGAICAAAGPITIGSGSFTVSMFGLDESAMRFFQLSGLLTLIQGVVFLVVGIIGVRLCNQPYKTMILMMAGIVGIVATAFVTLYYTVIAQMALDVTEQIIQKSLQSYGLAADDSVSTAGIAGGVWDFFLPALIIVGALLNKLPPKPAQQMYAMPQMYSDPQQAYTPPPQDGAPYGQYGQQQAYTPPPQDGAPYGQYGQQEGAPQQAAYMPPQQDGTQAAQYAQQDGTTDAQYGQQEQAAYTPQQQEAMQGAEYTNKEGGE